MYNMQLNTGYAGKPHVTAENCADLNRGIVGSDSYVLPVGAQFEVELVTNNILKIKDGCGCMQGRQVSIAKGQTDEITIENGTQGEKRIDLVVIRYSKNADTGIETAIPFLVKGIPSENNPVRPEHLEGDIRGGDLTADWPLYELYLDGISVTNVKPLFDVLMSVDSLNRKLPACNEIYTGVANHAQYDIPDITPYDLLVIYGGPGTYANTSMVVPVASIVYKDDGQFALGVYQGSSTFWELEFNFPTSTKINIANYKNQSWTTPAIRKILGIKL